MTPTSVQIIYGPSVGSNSYGFFWSVFATANFISYAYVVGLSESIGFNNLIYIVLGMCCIAVPLVLFPTFQGYWMNSTKSLSFCISCKKIRIITAK